MACNPEEQHVMMCSIITVSGCRWTLACMAMCISAAAVIHRTIITSTHQSGTALTEATETVTFQTGALCIYASLLQARLPVMADKCNWLPAACSRCTQRATCLAPFETGGAASSACEGDQNYKANLLRCRTLTQEAIVIPSKPWHAKQKPNNSACQ